MSPFVAELFGTAILILLGEECVCRHEGGQTHYTSQYCTRGHPGGSEIYYGVWPWLDTASSF